MTNDFIICTFYTPSYRKYLPAWEQHARSTGYDYTARELPDRGKWSLNDCIKPEFIRDMLVEYPTKNVVWVDIDGKIQKKPTLFEGLSADEYDFAGYPYTLNEDEKRFVASKYAYKKLWNDRLIWGGTLWFGNTERALTLLNLWIESCDKDPHRYVGDQDNLNEVLDKYALTMGLRFYALPVLYALGASHSKRPEYEGYGKIEEGVIVHDFASNEVRRQEGMGGNKWERALRS